MSGISATRLSKYLVASTMVSKLEKMNSSWLVLSSNSMSVTSFAVTISVVRVCCTDWTTFGFTSWVISPAIAFNCSSGKV